jgi:hypothetical protein
MPTLTHTQPLTVLPQYAAGACTQHHWALAQRLRRGLVAAWAPGLGRTGHRVLDDSNAHLDGRFQVMPVAGRWTASPWGPSVKFTRTDNERFEMPSRRLVGLRRMSIVAAVRWTGTASADEYTICANWGGGTPRMTLLRYLETTSQCYWYIDLEAGTGVGGAFAGTELTQGEWHVICCWWDGTNMFMSVDSGVSTTSIGGAGRLGLDVTTAVWVGNSNVNFLSDEWQGDVAAILVYDHALRDAERTALVVDPLLPLRSYATTPHVEEGYTYPTSWRATPNPASGSGWMLGP